MHTCSSTIAEMAHCQSACSFEHSCRYDPARRAGRSVHHALDCADAPSLSLAQPGLQRATQLASAILRRRLLHLRMPASSRRMLAATWRLPRSRPSTEATLHGRATAAGASLRRGCPPAQDPTPHMPTARPATGAATALPRGRGSGGSGCQCSSCMPFVEAAAAPLVHGPQWLLQWEFWCCLILAMYRKRISACAVKFVHT